MAPSKKQTYSNFGPARILSFDWNNLYHRTSSVSCLVQGVYMLERDRQKKRVGHNSIAKDWYEQQGFILDKRLIDKKDNSIYGAVFRKGDNYENTSSNSPKYVIALRGTIMKPKTFYRDFKTNMCFLLESLDCSSRCAQLTQEVKNYVDTHGNTAVWIAGHSQGAGLALRAGKIMAISGSPVEAYIFNPPSSMFPLEQLVKHHEKLKCKVRLARDVFKSGLLVAISLVYEEVLEEAISLPNLALWKPHLFLNILDPICSEHLGNFRYRDQIAGRGREWIARLAARCSLRSLMFAKGEKSLPQHLHSLPSAIVIENKIKFDPLDLLSKHGIHQWWNPELERKSTRREYESNYANDDDDDDDDSIKLDSD